jgi:hypothetical protein
VVTSSTSAAAVCVGSVPPPIDRSDPWPSRDSARSTIGSDVVPGTTAWTLPRPPFSRWSAATFCAKSPGSASPSVGGRRRRRRRPACAGFAARERGSEAGGEVGPAERVALLRGTERGRAARLVVRDRLREGEARLDVARRELDRVASGERLQQRLDEGDLRLARAGPFHRARRVGEDQPVDGAAAAPASAAPPARLPAAAEAPEEVAVVAAVVLDEGERLPPAAPRFAAMRSSKSRSGVYSAASKAAVAACSVAWTRQSCDGERDPRERLDRADVHLDGELLQRVELQELALQRIVVGDASPSFGSTWV